MAKKEKLNFAVISIDSLKEKIEKAKEEYVKSGRYGITRWCDDYFSEINDSVTSDFSKFSITVENLQIEKEFIGNSSKLSSDPMNRLVGYNTLENGLTFLGIRTNYMFASDEVSQVFFIIYFDGKSLRAYMPFDGNGVYEENNYYTSYESYGDNFKKKFKENFPEIFKDINVADIVFEQLPPLDANRLEKDIISNFKNKKKSKVKISNKKVTTAKMEAKEEKKTDNKLLGVCQLMVYLYSNEKPDDSIWSQMAEKAKEDLRKLLKS